MRLAAVLLLPALCFCGDPLDLISESRLEAIHAQRMEWAKNRVVVPPQGIYQDFRAVLSPPPSEEVVSDARQAGVQILLRYDGVTEMRDGILVLPVKLLSVPMITPIEGGPGFNTSKGRKSLIHAFKDYPEEVFAIAGKGNLGEHPDLAFRTSTAHILARELSEPAIRASIAAQRDYDAEDWLCDPTGFHFVAENNLGVYDIGDNVPLLSGTHLRVNLPVPAHIQMYLMDGKVTPVTETTGRDLDYALQKPGDYWVDVSLPVGESELLWIKSSMIHVAKPAALDVPVVPISDSVEVRHAIPYLDDGIDKHRLDLYLPRGKTNFPVMVFYHGGAWRMGDRSTYALVGYRMAKAGIGVAIPSYRLMPGSPHPAQIEDAAAAFAWVYKNIAQYGGDVSRLYLAGHSAGGHLAALLALDGRYLDKVGVPASAIRGVATMSGVYDVGTMKEFQNADDDPSPIHHVRADAPPFLITYCQWDYFGLPKQARDFAAALQKKFVAARLVYVPGQSHVSEIMNTIKDDDITARALIEFVR